MRTIISLGRSWFYMPRFDELFTTSDYPLEAWERVDLPHANKELPYNAFDEHSYQFISTYARELDIPELHAGARAFIDFDGRHDRMRSLGQRRGRWGSFRRLYPLFAGG